MTTKKKNDGPVSIGEALKLPPALAKAAAAVTHKAPGSKPGASPKALTNRDAALIDDTVSFCESIGMTVLNPHSYVVQEGGMVSEMDPVLQFKKQTDPYRLLNPGKVEDTFYGEGAVVGSSGSK